MIKNMCSYCSFIIFIIGWHYYIQKSTSFEPLSPHEYAGPVKRALAPPLSRHQCVFTVETERLIGKAITSRQSFIYNNYIQYIIKLTNIIRVHKTWEVLRIVLWIYIVYLSVYKTAVLVVTDCYSKAYLMKLWNFDSISYFKF